MMMYRSHHPTTASLRREVRLRRYRQLLLLNAKLADPTNPLTKYTEHHFQEMYRLSKESFHELLSIIEGDLDRLDNRGRPLPASYQLLLALHFYCTGSYQKEVGEQHGLEVSQPTVCRTIHRVSEALAQRYSQFVVFPSTTQASEIHERFYKVAQFPNVIGAIDCIHMKISNPGGTMAEQCRNSKGWYSINCQVVVGPDMRILTAIVRWGGSVPDWLIYDNSRLRRVLEHGEYGHLVGDAAYQCQRYLLTPLPCPSTPAERSYNRAHSSTRRRARRAFGMIRRRFQCTARELRSNPKTSCAVILSCFALHNFMLQRQGPQEDAEALYAPDDGPQDRFSGECDPEGESYRQHIIHEWFSSDAPEEERSGREISSLRDILGWAVSTPTREEHGLGKLTETKNSSDMQIHACMTTYHPLSSLDHLADPAGSDHSLPWNQLVKMNPPLLLFADMLGHFDVSSPAPSCKGFTKGSVVVLTVHCAVHTGVSPVRHSEGSAPVLQSVQPGTD